MEIIKKRGRYIVLEDGVRVAVFDSIEKAQNFISPPKQAELLYDLEEEG